MTEEEVNLLDQILQSDKVVKSILADIENCKPVASMAEDASWHNRHIKQLAAELRASRVTY